MPTFKIHSAEVRRYGEPAIIITTADSTNARWWHAEYFVLIPDEANTLIAQTLDFEVNAFAGTPLVLNEEFVLTEALGQARIDLNLYLQQHASKNEFVLATGTAIVESNINALLVPCMRGTFPQIDAVHSKTKSGPLADAIRPLRNLPKVIKGKL